MCNRKRIERQIREYRLPSENISSQVGAWMGDQGKHLSSQVGAWMGDQGKQLSSQVGAWMGYQGKQLSSQVGAWMGDQGKQRLLSGWGLDGGPRKTALDLIRRTLYLIKGGVWTPPPPPMKGAKAS